MSHAELLPTKAIAEFCAEMSSATLPGELRELAASAIVAMATSARDRGDDVLLHALNKAANLGAAGPATVIPNRSRRTAPVAAEINAASAALGHPRPADQLADVVAAAALSGAEASGSSEHELLLAVALGLEIATRVALALGPSHVARGWHLPGTAGRLGAAVAASKLSGNDSLEIHSAMAYASTEAAGLDPRDDRAAAMVIAGRAAHDGVEAAVLAAAGLLGPVAALEGRRGLLALLSDEADVTLLTDELGVAWRSSSYLELAPANGSSPPRDLSLVREIANIT